MDKPPQDNLKRLEFKVNVLLGFCVAQTLLLTMIITATALSKMTYYLTVIVLVLLLASGAYIFRKQIPGWFGNLSRLFFASLLSPKSDSKNDG